MKLLYLLFIIVLTSGVSISQDGFVDGVDLTTNTAPWTMRILDNDLDITNVQVKQNESSAYVMMASASTKLNVSVYIEPVDKCKSAEECRDYVLGLGNPAWGKYEQLAKGKLRDFSYFEFYRPEAQGRPLKMLDMYAEYVSQGYWVDLHISKALYTKEDHALFEKVINSITFVPANAQKTAFDLQKAKAEAAVVSWLAMWEKRKCKESYAALAGLSRDGIKEPDWVEYCTDLNKQLGANKTRRLIAAAFARSLPDKTARPLAVLAYRSTFANQPVVVELTALMLEQNGSWIMTNYLLR